MTLQELVNYKNQYRTPFIFYIDYTSDIAPDDNTCYGIASKEWLVAFSYSGRIYRTIDGINWILSSEDWDDVPNTLILRRIFDKNADDSHSIEFSWKGYYLETYIDGSKVLDTQNIAKEINASSMTLSELSNWYTEWSHPFIYYIDWSSAIATPDGATSVGIGCRDLLFAISANGNIYKSYQSEPWQQVSVSRSEIDALKQSFQAGVDTLYNACVSAGQTPTDKSPSSIANAIQQIANSVNITNLGSGTSIDVKSKLPNDYSRLSINNFIVELVKITADGGARNVDDSIYPQFGTIAANATMSKSYNNITGILTISGLECHNTSQTTGWVRYVNGYATVNVYAIY